MKKSFMTRVLAVSLSAAMTFSLSAANMATASAATKNVVLSPSTVTLQYGTSKAKKTLKLKNNSLKWKVKSASVAEKGSAAKGKKVLTVSKTSSKVVLKAKNIKKTHKVTVTVKLKRTKNKKNYSKTLKCKATVKPQKAAEPDNPTPTPTPTPDVPAQFGGTATATSTTRVEVKFNQVVDDATLVKENFSVDAEGVQVTQVDKGDGRNVVLTLSGANANTKYALSYKNLTVDGQAVEGNPIEFTTPASATEGYYLLLETNSDQVLADGHSNTLITCTVRDKDGNVYDKDDFVIKFETNGRGHFTRSEVATSKGQTTNTLISEALDKAEDVIVTAQIVRSVRDNDLGEQFKGTKGEKKLTMTPELVNAKYNPIASVESNYADRITLRFQDNVDDDFYKTNGAMDPDTLKVEVFDDLPSTGDMSGRIPNFSNAKNEDGVVELKEVPGEPKALHVLVNKPLTDGGIIGVRVTQKNPVTNKNQVFTDYFKLTDSQRPSLMSVMATDRRTLRVTFSEAVLTSKVTTDSNSNYSYRADDARNYSINRDRLSDFPKWGVDESSFTVGTGIGEDDDRNVVTIKLGKKADGDYARFEEEVETLLSASNIGDWAAHTDKSNNVMETDELYFTAPKDDAAPAIAKVDVQSPEQYLVTFNSPVEMSASYGNSHSDVVGIAARNANNDTSSVKDTAEVVKENSVIQLVEGSTNLGAKDGSNPIRVTAIDADHTTYLIETTKDWTKVYGSTGYYNDNYNTKKYQLKIPADAIVNINNGVKNSGEIVEELTAKHTEMQTLDVTQPVADDLSWDGKSATVTFNEPVKVRLEKQKTGLNKEGLTPSIRQEKDNSEGVQHVTATFHATGYQEVTGTINRISDNYDKQIVVTPNQELTGSEAGVDWNLTIRGISDDVGNTGTVTKGFKVTNKTTGFKVAWASVSTSPKFSWTANGFNGDLWNAGTGSKDVSQSMYVFVKFTGQIGNEAMRARNYTLNSSQLSTNVKIYSGIDDYDGNSSIKDSITIELPWNVASLINEHPEKVMLAITNEVVSTTGQKLENNIEYQLPYNIRMHEADNGTRDDDAVFGDDADEQPYSNSNSVGIKGSYRAAIEEAIESDAYRKIILAQGIDELNVNRPVDIELNGGTINKLTASFNDGATCNITNRNRSTVTATIGEFVINTPNADWKLNAEKENLSSPSSDPNIVFKKVDIRRMPANTLKNWADITKLEVNTLDTGVKIENQDTGKIGEIVMEAVNKNGKVTVGNLNPGNNIKKITVNSAVQIFIDKDSTGTIDEVFIDNKVEKDVVLQLNANYTKGKIGIFSGRISAAKVKDSDGKDKDEDELLTDVFNSVNAASVEDLKATVLARLNDSVTVTNGAILLSDLVKDSTKPIYESSAKIFSDEDDSTDDYDIVISLDITNKDKEESLVKSNKTQFRDDLVLKIASTNVTELPASVTVYIKKWPAKPAGSSTRPNPEYTKVTDIKVTQETGA